MTVQLTFSVRHAYITLLGLSASALLQTGLPLAISVCGSITYWLWQQRTLLRTTGFGIANAVTSIRLVCLLLLARLFDAHLPLSAALLALVIFCLDGLDGYLARRTHSESALGAMYDAEVDANFTLLLTWGLFQLGHVAAWVLIGGLLRYAYVISLHLTKVHARDAPRTSWGRYGFALSVSGYSLSVWPAAEAATVLSGLATLLLCYSFSRSFRASFGSRPPNVAR